MRDKYTDFVDELTYRNYAANRSYAPDISPERWAKVYGEKSAEFEVRYQTEFPEVHA